MATRFDQPKLWTYDAFDTMLRSSEPLPELAPLVRRAARRPVLRVTFGAVAPKGPIEWAERHRIGGRLWLSCGRTGKDFLVRIHGVCDYVVAEDGATVDALGRASSATRHALLDHVVPIALSLRGADSFHASSVTLDGRVVLFCAPSGTGKSTLAASFLADGGTSVSDDCTIVSMRRGTFVARAGYPGVRLCRPALAWLARRKALGWADDYVSAPSGTKRRFTPRALRGGPVGALPLAGVFLLRRERDRVPRAERGGAGLAIRLFRHAFRLVAAPSALVLRQMDLCARIVDTVPTHDLVLPEGLEHLASVRDHVRAVVGDARG